MSNPKAGFVQNCNATPFATTTCGNPDPGDYPNYVVSESNNARSRISRRILWNKPKFTIDEWARAGFDPYVIQAKTEIPELVRAWSAKPNAKVSDAIAELRDWDHVSRVDSVPMSLFTLWHKKQYGTAVIRPPKAAQDPVQSLEQTVDELTSSFGTSRAPWGDLNRLERRQSGGAEPFRDDVKSLTVAGAPGDVGIVFNFHARPEKDQKWRYGVAGHSLVSVVEFGPEVKARSVLVFGENSDPASNHYFDQSELYAKQEFKPAYFTVSDIKAHADERYHPGERHK